MTDHSEIDQAILAVCSVYWRKVAMVVATAEQQLAEREDRNEFLDLIGLRVIALVEAGNLQGAGDLHNWRRSEVRFAPKLQ